LTIGKYDQDYFSSEVAHLILGDHAVKYGYAYKVATTLSADEMGLIPVRFIPSRYMESDLRTAASFLRGLYSANGSVVTAGSAFRVTLKTTSSALVEQVQVLLSALGFVSFFTTNKAASVEWANGAYKSRESYDVNISGRYGQRFLDLIGFVQAYKNEKLRTAISGIQKQRKVGKVSHEIRDVSDMGEMEVFDIRVTGPSHTYWSGGCNVSNCSEVPLSVWGGLCLIGDLGLAHVTELSQAVDAARLTAQFLIRCNLMKSEYAAEVRRTNRIGVSLTGIHEMAWKLFGCAFGDLVSYYDCLAWDGATLDAQTNIRRLNHKAHGFWCFVQELQDTVTASAADYSKRVGLPAPHTASCIKPSGTISKVLSCTEGAHLPALAYYLRWVMYLQTDPDLELLRGRGYPVKDVSDRYSGHSVVGFPTRQPLADLMCGAIVTADEVSVADNFKWVRLLERFWIGPDGGQVSYTLKYSAKTTTYQDFMDAILEWQPKVRCCAVMPQSDWRETEKVYGYVPEQPISKAEYDALTAAIVPVERESYSEDSLACEGGACPIEPDMQRASLTA
jgi:hypothetical protein